MQRGEDWHRPDGAEGADGAGGAGAAARWPTAEIPVEPLAPGPGGPDLPEGLHDPLFGPLPDRTCPPCFALLDSAAVPGLPEMLEGSGLEHRILYAGDAAETLADAAPWLVRLEPGSRFVRGLFTRGEAPWDLWDARAGVLMRGDTTVAALRDHLRHFTRLRSREDDAWRLLRFHAPGTMRALVEWAEPAALARLTDPLRWIGVPAEAALVSVPVPEAAPGGAAPAPGALPLEALLTPAARRVLAGERLARYEREAVAFLRARFAPAMALVDDAAARLVVRTAYGHARLRGVTTTRGHLSYLVPVMFWGSHFETDPLHAAALRRAGWTGADGAPRPGAAFAPLTAEVDAWTVAVASDTASPQRIARGVAELAAGPFDAAAFPQRLATLWPARNRAVSPADGGAFVAAAADVAQRAGLSAPDVALYGALAPYFGYRFGEDPRFPWAQRALATSDADARRLALGQGVAAYWTAMTGDDP